MIRFITFAQSKRALDEVDGGVSISWRLHDFIFDPIS